LALTARLINYS